MTDMMDAVEAPVTTEPVSVETDLDSPVSDAPFVTDVPWDTSRSTTPDDAGDMLEAPASEPVVEHLFEVDGQQVTLEDARQNWMLRRDYTQKTQELADMRREAQAALAIEKALQANPQRALEVLARTYGVQLDNPLVAQPQPAPVSAPADPWGDEPEAVPTAVDPAIAQQLQQMQRFMADQEQQATNAQIDREVAQLKTAYGDFDEFEVFTHALDRNMSVTDAFKAMNFEKLLEAQRRTQEEVARTDAKRGAQVVSGGATKATGGGPPPKKVFKSMRESAMSAFADAGLL